MDFESDVKNSLKKAGIKEIKLECPPDSKLGDLAFACFKLGGNPLEKAKEIASKIKPNGSISNVQALGPYVNFFIDNEKLVKSVLSDASKKNFGKGKKGEKILIEHTSINPNASPHVGRSRNALIGDSITRTLRFYGHSVETHYFVNDIGKQIAMLAYTVQRDKIKKLTFEEMLNLYVKTNAEMMMNVTMERGVFELIQKLESGDKSTIALFEKVSSMAFKGQRDILKRLNITYNKVDYESQFLKDMKTINSILKKLESKMVIGEEGQHLLNMEGYDLPMKEPVLPLTRANGTSLYALRDIAYHIYKSKIAKNNIVVLGEDHKLEAMQIKIILENMLGIKAPKVVHYSFILLQGNQKMSTRKGNVVLLTEFMREAKEKAKKEIESRHNEVEPENLNKISKIIGYGALKYSILKVGAEKNVIFSWDDAMNFEGDSAPYIQYTYVRAKKILGNLEKEKPKKLILNEESEIKLIKKIAEFPNVVEEVCNSYRVHITAKYAFELATIFIDFYEKCNVLNEINKEKKFSRRILVDVYSKVIKDTLMLLGIEVPEFM